MQERSARLVTIAAWCGYSPERVVIRIRETVEPGRRMRKD
jgi:hypothetical protein